MGLNLRGIANGLTRTVNPNVTATIQRSTGYTPDAAGNQIPAYAPVTVSVQVQAASTGDILKMDALNVQGVRRVLYVSAEVEGTIRGQGEGGDLITFPAGTLPEGTDWKVSSVIEMYGDYRKVAIVLQNPAVANGVNPAPKPYPDT